MRHKTVTQGGESRTAKPHKSSAKRHDVGLIRPIRELRTNFDIYREFAVLQEEP